MKSVIIKNLMDTLLALEMTMPIVPSAREYTRGYENGIKYAIDMIEWYDGNYPKAESE